MTFTITVTNHGPAPASGVVVTDTLPSGATYYSSNASQGTCTGTATVTCSLGTIDPSATGTTTTATVTITVLPAGGGTLTNQAAVTAANATVASAGASASASVTVSAPSTTTTVTVAPVVASGAASQISPFAATLSGVVNPAGQATTYAIQFGTSTGYGSTLTTGTLPAATIGQGVVTTTTSLRPNTAYHFRIVGTNATGSSNGQDVTFTTPKARLVSITVSARHRGSHYSFVGRLRLPSALSTSIGCIGSVTVRLTHGRRVISARRATLGSRCRFVSSARLTTTGTFGVAVVFAGNSALLAKSRTLAVLIR